MVTTRGLRMAWHAEGQSVAKPRGRTTRLARPSVSVCNLAGHEMTLLVEMIVDLRVN
jgi:hypothetical protein